jgi:hypothetical protein
MVKRLTPEGREHAERNGGSSNPSTSGRDGPLGGFPQSVKEDVDGVAGGHGSA